MDKEIDEMRAWLNKHKDIYETVQIETGLRRSWITQFASGRIADPSASKILALSKFIIRENNHEQQSK